MLPALNLLAAVQTLDIRDMECSLCTQILTLPFRTLKTGAGWCFTVEGKRADIVTVLGVMR